MEGRFPHIVLEPENLEILGKLITFFGRIETDLLEGGLLLLDLHDTVIDHFEIATTLVAALIQTVLLLGFGFFEHGGILPTDMMEILVLLGLCGIDDTDVLHQLGDSQEGRFLGAWQFMDEIHEFLEEGFGELRLLPELLPEEEVVDGLHQPQHLIHQHLSEGERTSRRDISVGNL